MVKKDDMISPIAPYRPLYGFRHLLTKRHPFCIYAAYNDLLCCLTILKRFTTAQLVFVNYQIRRNICDYQSVFL